jgi:orotate phosphoribosyltransferase
MTRDELLAAIRELAYLEGDFVLRSGRRSDYYLDKYRFETEPDVLAALGDAVAAAIAEHDREADRIAGPTVGGVVVAAAASLASRVPFLIVRGEQKAYGTGKRIEGAYEPGERVCLVEDVVTTGGALVEAVAALREAGLECRTAICIVDREEGGSDVLARHAVRLRPLFRASEVVEAAKSAANPHG